MRSPPQDETSHAKAVRPQGDHLVDRRQVSAGQPVELSRTNRSRPALCRHSSASSSCCLFSWEVSDQTCVAHLPRSQLKTRTHTPALVAKGAAVPPVPIPNTVVQRSSTYNTAGSTPVGRSAAASAGFLCQGDRPQPFTNCRFHAILKVPKNPGMSPSPGPAVHMVPSHSPASTSRGRPEGA